MYGESPAKRPDEGDCIGALFALLLVVIVLFGLVAAPLFKIR